MLPSVFWLKYRARSDAETGNPDVSHYCYLIFDNFDFSCLQKLYDHEYNAWPWTDNCFTNFIQRVIIAKSYHPNCTSWIQALSFMPITAWKLQWIHFYHGHFKVDYRKQNQSNRAIRRPTQRSVEYLFTKIIILYFHLDLYSFSR